MTISEDICFIKHSFTSVSHPPRYYTSPTYPTSKSKLQTLIFTKTQPQKHSTPKYRFGKLQNNASNCLPLSKIFPSLYKTPRGHNKTTFCLLSLSLSHSRTAPLLSHYPLAWACIFSTKRGNARATEPAKRDIRAPHHFPGAAFFHIIRACPSRFQLFSRYTFIYAHIIRAGGIISIRVRLNADWRSEIDRARNWQKLSGLDESSSSSGLIFHCIYTLRIYTGGKVSLSLSSVCACSCLRHARMQTADKADLRRDTGGRFSAPGVI